jgi:hypothetical protein
MGKTVDERFDEKIWVNPTTGCHVWTGPITEGYGRFYWNKHFGMAHRYALARKLGRAIAPGLTAHHECYVPLCVNPAHLREATYKEQRADLSEAGRIIQDENLAAMGLRARKFNDSQAEAIRARYRSGRITQTELAREYGTVQKTISYIINHVTYK